MGKPHSVFFLTSPHQGFDAIFTNFGDDLVLSHFFGKDIVKQVDPNIEANEELCRGILVYLQYSGVNSIDSTYKRASVKKFSCVIQMLGEHMTPKTKTLSYDHVVKANYKSPDIMTDFPPKSTKSEKERKEKKKAITKDPQTPPEKHAEQGPQ